MAEPNAAPEDIGLAGQGDRAALRRIRDFWFAVASGETALPHLPREEALPQAELLAELAAGSGEPEDLLALVVSYQIRMEVFEHSLAAVEALAKEAVEANAVDSLNHWTLQVVDIEERLARYRAKSDVLLQAVFGGTDAAGPAMIISILTLQADRGDERAAMLLQSIMDSVTPERATAIQAAVRAIEMETAQ